MRHEISVVVFAFVVGVTVLIAGVPRRAASADPRDDAIKVAKLWLARIDSRQYDASWEEAAGHFKRNVKKDQWVSMASGVRDPLGKLRSRELKSATHATSLPGAPDGEYFVIQFETSFENKKSAIETITPMRDADGTWRVSGYYIR